jgi:ElaB/YqjD/DUF883 family membrane-anchored ribosome-binding protein
MDENRIEGAVKKGVGRVQDAVGAALGDGDLQLKGKLNKVVGRAQDAYGQAADQARQLSGQAADQARQLSGQAAEQARQLGGQANDWVSENPWPAVGVAVLVGLVLGLLVAS